MKIKLLTVIVFVMTYTAKAQNLKAFQDEGKTWLWGYKDLSGKIIINPTYGSAEDFYLNIGKVCNKSKCGFIDKKGTVIIPLIYDDDGGMFFNPTGRCPVKLKNKWGLIDKKGNEILPLIYDNVLEDFDQAEKSTGFIAVKLNKLWGLTDTTGKIIIPLEYDDISPLSEGVFILELNSKYGYINSAGKHIAPCIYEEAEPFEKGKAKVSLNKKSFYIDKNGKKVL